MPARACHQDTSIMMAAQASTPAAQVHQAKCRQTGRKLGVRRSARTRQARLMLPYSMRKKMVWMGVMLSMLPARQGSAARTTVMSTSGTPASAELLPAADSPLECALLSVEGVSAAHRLRSQAGVGMDGTTPSRRMTARSWGAPVRLCMPAPMLDMTMPTLTM